MARIIDQIKKGIAGRNPLIYVVSAEEERVLRTLQELSEELGADQWPVHTWSCIEGLSCADNVDATKDPRQALETILASPASSGLIVMRDLPCFFDRPDVVRALRDVYHRLRQERKLYLLIVSPRIVVPQELEKELHLVVTDLPGDAELQSELETIAGAYPNLTVPSEFRDEIVLALKGLTLAEVDHIMHRLFDSEETARDALIEEIITEKEMIVRKSGCLEFVPSRWNMADMGGLDSLKDWLIKREKVFRQEAVEAGVPLPRGLLVMGVSGCGKSLAAKVISAQWKAPLFRLDMNLVCSGVFGTPEATFHKALRTIESVTPAVLWIDEIENSLSMEENQSQGSSHIFSTFLTWMQEKPPLIFVAATANRIHALPAELIRKGRFDQIFFVDLPNEKERKEIFKIHLRKNGADPADFDLEMLAIVTDGWNGAEIEQAVVSARVDSYYEDRAFKMADVTCNTSRIVPLSKTMEEQIKHIRNWAFQRATPASKYTRVQRS